MAGSARYTAILDACVLYPATLRDLLLSLTRDRLYHARWSDRIQDECVRSLRKRRPELEEAALRRTCELMGGGALARGGRVDLMANFISEDQIEQALLQRLQHLCGYDALNCFTATPDDVKDGSGRSDKREVILAGRLRAAVQRLNPQPPATAHE